jgi:RimJ/RimL family protein N-acetyltransferase
MTIAAEVTLRPVEPADEAFLLDLYASTRADELALTPWNAAQRRIFVEMQFAAQAQHYRSHHPAAAHRIIEEAGRPIGRFYVDRGPREIHVLDLTLLPAFRGRGTGTALLRGLMGEGFQTDRPVSIYVESFNRSLRLFQRLGFAGASETGAHILMTWRPNGVGANHVTDLL